ncbi:kelch domain-containing protein 1 [Hippocampus comes]|uniref:Kelch domain containing 1 n=1 Tax=Hippocampus comes TaxID=109280 RepID=A0A3Q2X9P5_HIPCM|nr:PREDICTED: kelch domain-containing protein 1 [Hippocampus comes]XP_019728160.1 PREDICTED: kelch domain-containing protein 1 [Hippocampus comes]XP_019728161.1 PREDICTED: kelch domain-containing protein 1 [Hippocampus comes]
MESSLFESRLELVARERSGHTAVVEGDLLYVWGGYMSLDDDEVFLPSDEFWVYDLVQGAWQVFHMTGEVPPSMSGSCSCSLNGHMYIFGGCDDNGQTNQIYRVKLSGDHYAWTKVVHRVGSAPSPRDKLSCWVHKGRIIYFGGYGHKLVAEVDRRNRSFIVDDISEGVMWGWNNEVHMFDPTQSSWGQPQTHGRAPAPRAAQACAMLGNRGYICGGRVKETRKNDIHCLDLDSWMWSEIVPVSSVPVGRSWHSLTAASDSSLFLFGGLSVDCKPMSDGWVFDVETKTWGEVEHPFKNKPRLWHTACPGKDSDVIVFGGSCDYILLVDTGHCNDALVFQMAPYPLFRICEDYIAKNAREYDALRKQLPLLPPKLCASVRRRMSFYRPSKKQHTQVF